MDSMDRGSCPLPGIGHCLYERCPYWDAERQECDADCLQSRLRSETETPEDCCIIHWTEDYD